MTTETLTLSAFLEARIADDEAVALAVKDESFNGLDGPITTGDDPWPSERAFAERLTPARVLAECKAKRAIVELHAVYPTPQRMIDGTIEVCSTCGSVDDAPVEFPCPTLRALASVYADHPSFDPRWSM